MRFGYRSERVISRGAFTFDQIGSIYVISYWALLDDICLQRWVGFSLAESSGKGILNVGMNETLVYYVSSSGT
jgi:hypothetical protein